MYLLHAMSAERLQKVKDVQAWPYLLQKKQQGRIRRLGFSFHDSHQVLDQFLTELPEAELVQLQINYADWEDERVRSRQCYEVAQKHGKPVIVMEPIRGGSLASERSVCAPLLKEAEPEASLASWALRFVAGLPGVAMVLSGMSNYTQMEQNVDLFDHMQPLTQGEQELLTKASEMLRSASAIPCTKCRYCVEGCPAEINIPAILDLLNEYDRFGSLESAKHSYGFRTRGAGLASACVSCGQCLDSCPQHIEAAVYLEKAAKLFE